MALSDIEPPNAKCKFLLNKVFSLFDLHVTDYIHSVVFVKHKFNITCSTKNLNSQLLAWQSDALTRLRKILHDLAEDLRQVNLPNHVKLSPPAPRPPNSLHTLINSYNNHYVLHV